MRVSILVFVELALDANRSNAIAEFGRMFQSLFSWNLLLMRGGGEILAVFLEFQSLFSWNLLLMPE